MKYAITTPTGHIGSRVTELLLDAGKDVTLLVRDASKVSEFTSRGATATEGSLEDVDYVLRATAGADVLFWLSPPNYAAPDLRAYQNVLGDVAACAITENGIEYVVNLSSLGAQHSDGNGPVNGLHDIEQKLNATAANITHLRPTAFFENTLHSLGSVKESGAMYMPVSGATSVPMIATRDIGTYAAAVLTTLDWTGQRAQHLFGPKEYSHDEVAAIYTGILETPVAHVQVPAKAAKAAMTGMGLTEDLAGLYIELYESFGSGHFRAGVEEPDYRGETTFEEFAREVARPAYLSS